VATAEERNVETDLRDAAAARGATVNARPNGHFQIRGRLLVNYYPFAKKRTAYVDATTHGKHNVSPTEAVQMAFSAPPIAPVEKKDKRKKTTHSKRARAWRKSNYQCHWCQKPLKFFEVTLEHVIPLHRGGLDNDNNRVAACAPCNHGRGHNMPELKQPQPVGERH
jgi:5-methylcytosine-specific restriction endonuclease McrA